MKNKSMNKILALGVVAAMTAGMLAGCGSSASTTDGAAAGTEAASNSAASNGEVPTLVWWTIGGTPADDFDQAVSQISDYAEEKIGVRIDVKIAGWADYETKMNNIINTGEYFDLMFVNNTNYTKFVNLNALENITDLVQTETPDLYNFIPTDLWEGAKIHGNVYAVPTYKDSSLTQFWMLDDAYVQKYVLPRYTKSLKKLFAGKDPSAPAINDNITAMKQIKELCDAGEQQASSTALEHFAYYLRGNMDSLSDTRLIPFSKEVSHVKDYLYLEKMRFEDRLIIVWELDVTDFLLPPLTLQPIVENAVRHGITEKKDGGTLTIRSEETDRGVLITVTDDGVGFDP